MASKTAKVVQGSDVAVTVQLQDSDTGLPFGLSGFTGCTGYFPKDPSGSLAVTGTLVSADLGKVSFAMDETQTAQLLTGTDLDIEVEIDRGSDKIIAQILGKLEVVERLFQ